MNCERMKDLIGDYIDDELGEALREEVKKHLNACGKCRQMGEALRGLAIEPLKKAEKIKAPEEIWQRIRMRIEQEEVARLLPDLAEKLRAFARLRKPTFAVATCITIILAALLITRLPLNGQKALNAYIEEQIEFFSYLADEEEPDYSGMDLGTAVEEYLL